jgi:hypothetical protein
LGVEVGEIVKASAPLRAEVLVPGRVMVEVPGYDERALQAVAETLVARGLAADVWPALKRATGVGFTDERVAVKFRASPDLANLIKAGVALVGVTRLPGVYRVHALDGDAIRAAFALLDLPEVVWAEPDLIRSVKPYGLPDDPELARQ